ncbi:MAG: HD-GYP domain-containing protein [Actinobacteria bacterium]|nr:HD-GYP domain-containing protein [Actinomycetota bacterium]
MNKNSNLVLRVYVFFIFLSGLAIFTYILLKYRGIPVLGVVLFGLLTFIADNLGAPLPKTGSVAVSFGISFASLILFGPPTAILVTAISFFNIREFVKKVPYYKHLFNAGQYFISMGVASIVFEMTYNRSVTNLFNFANVGFIILAAFIFFFLNTIFTAGAISISENKNFKNIWIYNFAWLIPFQLFLAAMAVAVSFLYKLYGPYTIIFTSLPLIIAQYTYMLRIKERKALLNSIMQIVKIIDAKDSYTAGHSVRVAEYAEKIARKLRLNEYDVEVLTNLANLHDIGKVQIDLSVLNKPGKFDDADWVEIKKHTEAGYKIVKEIVFLKNSAEAILYHHERINGKGYPYGIKGDKIPLFAKILTVADAYDAMTSDRLYRPVLTQKKAIKELQECADKEFDRKISSIMIEIIKEENPAEC